MQTVFPPSDLYNWVSRIYEPGSRLLLTEFAFPVEFGALAANGRSTQNVQMTQNADFVMTALDVFQNVSGVKDDYLINITDTTTGEQFSNISIPLVNITQWGNFNTRRNLTYPKWFSGISTVTIDLFSYSIQSAITLSLRGFKIQKLG